MLYGISNLHEQKTAYLLLPTGLHLRLHTCNSGHSRTAKGTYLGGIKMADKCSYSQDSKANREIQLSLGLVSNMCLLFGNVATAD